MTVADENAQGTINLRGVFQAKAQELLASVEQGKILHATHNIRESGGPLEDVVRKTFSALMPSTFSIGHGYLFDPASNCTPQIDMIISPAQRSHSMLKTPEGATYSPFSEAYAIGEIKASARNMRGHLEQVGKRIAALTAMRQSLYEPTNYRFPELISFLIVGDCNDLDPSAIVTQFDSDPDNFPDFILLADKGEIVLRPTGQVALFDDLDSEIGPTQRPDGTRPTAWASGNSKQQQQGNALLWLFYALLDRLRRSEAHDVVAAFSKLAQNDEIWDTSARQAADIVSRAADPFAAAMIRSIKLAQMPTLFPENTVPKKKGRPRGSKNSKAAHSKKSEAGS
jgi:hypothetical protein